jgi:hypothetical protein
MSFQSTSLPVYNLGVEITRREFGGSLASAIAMRGGGRLIQEQRVYSDEEPAAAVARAFPSSVLRGNTVRLTHSSWEERARAWDRFNASAAWQELTRGSSVELLKLQLS